MPINHVSLSTMYKLIELSFIDFKQDRLVAANPNNLISVSISPFYISFKKKLYKIQTKS